MTASKLKTRPALKPKNESASTCLLRWVQTASSDLVSRRYLIKSLNAHGIAYDVAIKHLIAHSAYFKCPALGSPHSRALPAQTRHVCVEVLRSRGSMCFSRRATSGLSIPCVFRIDLLRPPERPMKLRKRRCLLAPEPRSRRWIHRRNRRCRHRIHH
jgi:hypothetical protein